MSLYTRPPGSTHVPGGGDARISATVCPGSERMRVRGGSSVKTRLFRLRVISPRQNPLIRPAKTSACERPWAAGSRAISSAASNSVIGSGTRPYAGRSV